jgi:hypothetical protein
MEKPKSSQRAAPISTALAALGFAEITVYRRRPVA